MRRCVSACCSRFGSAPAGFSRFWRSCSASASRSARCASASARAVRSSRPSSSASAASHRISCTSPIASGRRSRWSCPRAVRNARMVAESFSKASGLAAMASSARAAGMRSSGARESCLRTSISARATGWLKERSGSVSRTSSETPSCSAPSLATRRRVTGSPAQGWADRSGNAWPRTDRVEGPEGKVISCASGAATGRAARRNSARSPATPQSSSARQGMRRARPR